MTAPKRKARKRKPVKMWLELESDEGWYYLRKGDALIDSFCAVIFSRLFPHLRLKPGEETQIMVDIRRAPKAKRGKR